MTTEDFCDSIKLREVDKEQGLDNNCPGLLFWENDMPTKPKHPCGYPGCPNLTDRRYCPEHGVDYEVLDPVAVRDHGDGAGGVYPEAVEHCEA